MESARNFIKQQPTLKDVARNSSHLYLFYQLHEWSSLFNNDKALPPSLSLSLCVPLFVDNFYLSNDFGVQAVNSVSFEAKLTKTFVAFYANFYRFHIFIFLSQLFMINILSTMSNSNI